MKYQGKDREEGRYFILDNRNEGHQNSSYWDQVYWVAALVSNGGSYPNGDVASVIPKMFQTMWMDTVTWVVNNYMERHMGIHRKG